MKARLILEDGQVFEGTRFGAPNDVITEIIFTTGSTGYVELLTDPSCAGQGVVMASPVVGNYGVFYDHAESARVWPDAFIVRSITKVENDERNASDLDEYLKTNGVAGISGVDTRLLTLTIREKGTMRGMITGDFDTPPEIFLEKIRSFNYVSKVPVVSTDKKTIITKDDPVFKDRRAGSPLESINSRADGTGLRIALMDYGVKYNIIRMLVGRGCEVITYPWDTPAEDVLADDPDGIVLSNGPGDPKACEPAIRQMRHFYDSGIPIFGICLGHQLLALGMGADTYKLKYGHRGANHSVKDLELGRCFVTSQNHSFCVDEKSVDPDVAHVSHINLNDHSVEGLIYEGKDIFTVQFHPEGSPGPMDTEFLFDRFINTVRRRGN